ncbi:MAG: serine/threonine-protein kinase [Pseudonocardiaceae bacterium]
MTTPPGITPADPAPRLVAGRYRLGALLGRGAMGTVWSAHDEVLGRPVAVKEVLLPPGIPDSEADLLRERSLREARAIAVLSHPNVVTLYDVVREGGAPFVVMELVASDSLAELLRKGPVPLQRVVAIGAAVAAALQAAHAAGITHRDVKPGNVLVAHDGRIKLTDFGIAHNPADQTMTATGLMLGSPAYIAPEVASGGQVSPAADLWGLGATLFAAVEGRPPYDAGDPVMTVSAVVLDEVPTPSCSGPMAEVIRGLMVKDPQARMPLSEVRRLLGQPLAAEPAAAAEQRPVRARPRPPQVPQPPGSSAKQLAAEPGPLPFAVPTDRATADRDTDGVTPAPRWDGTHRATGPEVFRTAVLWTLAILLFLGAASAGFAAARVATGDSVLPTLGTGAADGAVLVDRVLRVTEADGSQLARFTVGVPEGWLEFRQHGVLGESSGAVVRFVSPDGSELITVERVTGFLSDHVAEEYLESYRRELADLPELVESGRENLAAGALEATFRSSEGEGAQGELRRTSYLRLVPAGSDLWVVRVSVPTERQESGRTKLFEPVAASFTPDG